MEKLYYVPKSAYSTSDAAIKYIRARNFSIENGELVRTKNGKPYVSNPPFPLFFSLSNTNETLFIAFSDEEIGIDAEPLQRMMNFLPIVRKFPKDEQSLIKTNTDFLRHWTARESVVKYLGSTLSKELKILRFDGQNVYRNNVRLPINVHFQIVNDTLVCICSKKDFHGVKAEVFP